MTHEQRANEVDRLRELLKKGIEALEEADDIINNCGGCSDLVVATLKEMKEGLL